MYFQTEDLFPYVENKKKFVNDRTLKRSNYAEAISQIEAALSGEDPSPISTQTENGNTISTNTSTPTATQDTATAAIDTDAEKTMTTKPQPPPPRPITQKTEAVSKGKRAKPAPAQKATPREGRMTATQAKSKSAGKADDEALPPPTLPPPEVAEASSTIKVETVAEGSDMMGQMEGKALPEGTPETESPTSRSGRKIKPKKYVANKRTIYNSC